MSRKKHRRQCFAWLFHDPEQEKLVEAKTNLFFQRKQAQRKAWRGKA